MRPAFIYILTDPRTGDIRYVGKTCDPKRRFWDHIGTRFATHSAKWVRSLLQAGVRPVLEVIEEFDDHDARWEESERFYISYFRFLGINLTNQESGGVSGKCHSEETKRRLREVAKGRRLPCGAQARATAARMTPEGRANARAARIGKTRSIEAIEKHRAKMIGHVTSEETKQKMSAAAYKREAVKKDAIDRAT